MDSVIRFLERIGENASLSNISEENFESIVDELDVEPILKGALIRKSKEDLTGALNARGGVYCLIYAPDSQPIKEDEGQEGSEENEEDEGDVSSSIN